MIELAVFLGNPGPRYAGNRHNAAWLLCAGLPFYGDLVWCEKFKGLYAERDAPSGRRCFLKPQTFMNLSGESLEAAASFYKISPENIIVVHDELELPLGTLSLKYSGGLGGHNGLRSIRASLGTAEFWRLRIGIGRPDDRLPGEGGPPGSGKGIYEWVVSDFSAAERPALESVLAEGASLFVKALEGDPQKLLPEWAKKNVLVNDEDAVRKV
jgi:PTH1 family peptidyl-tRNA hydrolase